MVVLHGGAGRDRTQQHIDFFKHGLPCQIIFGFANIEAQPFAVAQRNAARLGDAHGGVIGIGINNVLHGGKNRRRHVGADNGTQPLHISLKMLRLVEIGADGLQACALFFQSLTGFFNGAAQKAFSTSHAASPGHKPTRKPCGVAWRGPCS